ncbi:TetR/AcrR family transcriptional regulator [Streptomyces sp. WM6378]|uniref:TetR/AcrR family transcriptional regulator n=1 Tax=Streptomyces sp. WM6378 TaxID=1415557 RepID=UPI0006AD8F10|nr:TetR/AcrR family transcriptional regulator [Streptomyces sp. WM6378]KOU40416.1 TetR family transcriptional regulator [Streptomyces sp. WM6378]
MAGNETPISSVWTRPHRQREQLSREQIVSEAVKLLDTEGLEALSMRRLGTRLGAGATSLYRHVASKDELIELVVDEVYGELTVPAAEDDTNWRQAVGAGAHSLRSMVLRHPWVASVLGQVGLVRLGPNVMRMSERMLAVFATAGFATEESDQAMNTVIACVIGMTISEAAYLSMIARSGKDEQEWLDSLRPAAEQAAQDYPRLREGQAAQRGRNPEQIREANFAYALDRVLDGLEARLGRPNG